MCGLGNFWCNSARTAYYTLLVAGIVAILPILTTSSRMALTVMVGNIYTQLP